MLDCQQTLDNRIFFSFLIFLHLYPFAVYSFRQIATAIILLQACIKRAVTLLHLKQNFKVRILRVLSFIIYFTLILTVEFYYEVKHDFPYCNTTVCKIATIIILSQAHIKRVVTRRILYLK